MTASVSLPPGYSFADELTVEPIDKRLAERIHQEHHSYMPYLDRVCICHYTGHFRDHIAGVVSFAMPRREAPIGGVAPTDIAEVARVTVCLDMDNLASCLMAAVQDKFVNHHARRLGVGLLLTFVHGEYHGSMFRALHDKGWRYDGPAKPAPSGNRENREIQSTQKERWVCPLETPCHEQTELGARA